MSQRVDPDRCAEILDRLDAWIDGDLEESEAAAMQAHVDGCESCRRERQQAEEVVAELRAMPEFDVPQRVLQAVHRRTRPRAMDRIHSVFEGAVRRPLPAVAALAAIVLMVVLVSPWRGQQGPQYSDEEIMRAAAETKLALAYVGSIARRAELRVKESVLDERVATKTMRSVRRSLQILGEAGSATVDPPATPQPKLKGS